MDGEKERCGRSELAELAELAELGVGRSGRG